MDQKDIFYFQWHITDRCNLRCKHCYQNSPNRYKDLTLDQLLQIANILDEACKAWNVTAEIALTGGEPFTRKEETLEILSCLDSKKTVSRIDILSNGLLIDEKIISTLKTIKKLNGVQISLESSYAEVHDAIRGNGTFDKAVKTIKLLKKNELKVGTMMTLSKLNYDKIAEMYEFLHMLNIDYFGIDRFIPEMTDSFGFNENILSQHELKQSYEVVKNLSLLQEDNNPKVFMNRPLFCLLNDAGEKSLGASCSAGGSTLTIMPDGSLMPCRRLNINIGNIFSDGIYNVWYNSEILWNLRNNNLLNQKCKECEYLTNCRGCRAMAYATTGNYMGEDVLCWKS